MLDDSMEGVLEEFVAESRENLDHLDQALIDLERQPGNRPVLADVFRSMHTIKGTSGFLGLPQLEQVTHASEELLGRLRDGKVHQTAAMITTLLETVDTVRSMLGHIEAEGTEGDVDITDLVQRLHDHLDPDTVTEAPAAAAPAPVETATPAVAESDLTEVVSRPEPASTPPVAAPAPVEEPAQPAPVTSSAPRPGEIAAAPVGLHSVPSEPTAASHGRPAGAEPADREEPVHAPAAAGHSKIRVDVTLLDGLMNLVGELVLARNQLVQRTEGDGRLAATVQRLNLITSELQEGVMRARMQPIENVFGKFPRVVRDLSSSCGKQVRLEVEGQETELDKTIIEAISDPLTHLVRNAVDHGIEVPADRQANGKSPEGVLALRAFHSGGQVNIEISDDGGGLDTTRIRRKAVELGLIRQDEAEAMSERQLADLVFLPGLSTAKEVTKVSGRGVGMDVVRTNIEKIGGSIDVQTQLGSGTTWRIKIPLTLAIIPALVVSSGGERFAIPQANVYELLRLERSASTAIEWIDGAPVYRLRGALLPLLFLDDVLGIERSEDRSAANIAVVESGEVRFGLVVDSVSHAEEIVVKPLDRHFSSLDVYAGATIMGDGRVALILDIGGVASTAGLSSTSLAGATDEAFAATNRGGTETLVIVSSGGLRRFGLPLSSIDRLEEMPVEKIEMTGHSEVVQYRGELLPIVRLSDVVGGGDTTGRARVSVIVCRSESGHVGIVVTQIHDIVETEVDRNGRPVAIVNGQVTDVIDVETLAPSSSLVPMRWSA